MNFNNNIYNMQIAKTNISDNQLQDTTNDSYFIKINTGIRTSTSNRINILKIFK